MLRQGDSPCHARRTGQLVESHQAINEANVALERKFPSELSFLTCSVSYAISIQMTQPTNARAKPAADEPPVIATSEHVPRSADSLGANRIDPALPGADEVRVDRTQRHDGWTPDRQRVFLNTLAETGIVDDACRAAGMSRQSAYAFRNRAAGAAFRVGWDAACQLSRRLLADEVLSRALNGTVEVFRQNGEVVAERHRFDNRFTMAALTRLDRICESATEENRAARIAAGEFDQFVEIVAAGGQGAAEFIARRRDIDSLEPDKASLLLERLDNYGRYGVGHPDEIDVSDVEPAERDNWNEDQVERARRSGLTARLDQAAARAEAEAAGLEAPVLRLQQDQKAAIRDHYRWKTNEDLASAADGDGGECDEKPSAATGVPKTRSLRRAASKKAAARKKPPIRRPVAKKAAATKRPRRAASRKVAPSDEPPPPATDSKDVGKPDLSLLIEAPALAPPPPPGPTPPTMPKLPTHPRLPTAKTGTLPRGADGIPFDGPPPSGWVAPD